MRDIVGEEKRSTKGEMFADYMNSLHKEVKLKLEQHNQKYKENADKSRRHQMLSMLVNFSLKRLWDCMDYQEALFLIEIVSLLVTFGRLCGRRWALNWSLVLHSIHKQMDRQRLWIEAWVIC